MEAVSSLLLVTVPFSGFANAWPFSFVIDRTH